MRPFLRRTLSRSLGLKLFVSHFLVALVASFTLLVAVYVLAPVIFGRLLGGGVTGLAAQAFGVTLLYSLLVAGAVAAVAAAAASLFVSGRIVRPIRRVLAAIRRISAGRHGERVPVGEADELGALSEGFNAMAASLQEAERHRLELMGDVSHELRTPLSMLEGYMEGLMEGSVKPSEELWALLYEEAERMRQLVNDLGRLSRAEAGRLDLDVAAVYPEHIVRIAFERMKPLFEEKGVKLESALVGELPAVLADGGRVVQVLTNLLSNALRHTPSEGRVIVEAEPEDGVVTFRVKDTGEGISPEDLPRVFERFYRTERSRSREGGGSGLGLAISRALIEAMGGELRAESPGPKEGGATLTFTLPVFRR